MLKWLFGESEFDKAYSSLEEDIDQWCSIKPEVHERLLELGELSKDSIDLHKAKALKFKIERRIIGEGKL